MLASSQTSLDRQHTRNANVIVAVLMVSCAITAALFYYFGYTYNLPQLYIPAVALLATMFFDILPLSLISKGRKNTAMVLVIVVFILNVYLVEFIVQGLGAIIALSVAVIVLAASGLAMSSYHSGIGVIAAILGGGVAFLLDILLGINRVRVPELERYTPYVLVLIAIPIIFLFVREFNRFSLQAKISIGILLTGGLTVGTLMAFGINRVTFIGNFLTNRYETSVTQKTENEINSTVQEHANNLNLLFEEAQNDLIGIARYRAELQKQKPLVSNGTYWNAAEKIFRLSGGQYGNSNSDISSVYIPNTYTPDEAMLTDINTSVYLDLLAPGYLESHPEVVAVYYISRLGYTVYYPNISLANVVPANLDPTTLEFYAIAEPKNDLEKLPRWTAPYQDPAGTGLIVTISVPVYNGNSFEGVMSADIQLARIAKTVSGIKLGQTGIPILTDANGLLITTTNAGYSYFGLQPEVVAVNDNPTLNVLDGTTPGTKEIAQKIISNQTGLSKLMANDVETYLDISPLETVGYKLAFIAPVSELNQDVIALREEVNTAVTNAFQRLALILGLLFIGAFLASLFVGQVITRPLTRLTETVEQIAGGNLSSRANVETEDESGLLAKAFNSMADRLNETLQGLEDRIAARTRELENVSESNARRAELFESIARISRIISSTQKLDQLLPQITETISNQLDYYHVGIFLVDTQREYAILAAANSEGGRVMLERGHRLRIGETGIVGYVAQAGMPRMALDVGQDAVYFNNPDLPETHSEIALPLRSGAEIIGALDVQSKTVNAFTEEDVNILSVLADQVSIAIQNARSYQQSFDALERAERVASQLGEQQWKQFITTQPLTTFHFDGINVQPAPPSLNSQTNQHAIPIVIRGIQIGTLKLSSADPEHKWDANELAMAQATAERTALAIETARLLQDAQKRAAKERAIGQISSRIGSLVNIDNIVQTTIQELGNTLPGTDVIVQFNPKVSGS